ncbi:hypothetical protein OCU04_004074 [Sclerotinia nivalis]|uniref:Uncharacterized protein n=1 Tax=Sclerotinia nivalis TaxID=352851 RepID=A0A9X0DMD6_9HELO|nr:hypothetical protein OCU04_004074 [Sclerotinia nivalis]
MLLRFFRVVSCCTDTPNLLGRMCVGLAISTNCATLQWACKSLFESKQPFRIFTEEKFIEPLESYTSGMIVAFGDSKGVGREGNMDFALLDAKLGWYNHVRSTALGALLFLFIRLLKAIH